MQRSHGVRAATLPNRIGRNVQRVVRGAVEIGAVAGNGWLERVSANAIHFEKLYALIFLLTKQSRQRYKR